MIHAADGEEMELVVDSIQDRVDDLEFRIEDVE